MHATPVPGKTDKTASAAIMTDTGRAGANLRLRSGKQVQIIWCVAHHQLSIWVHRGRDPLPVDRRLVAGGKRPGGAPHWRTTQWSRSARSQLSTPNDNPEPYAGADN
jgi:hypothetical protein